MIPIIILAIEDDDEREFMTWLYMEYRWLMFSKVKEIVHNDSTAEDLVHDAVIKLIDKAHILMSFDKRRLVPYIIETAKNTAKDFLRKNHIEILPLLDELEIETGEPAIEEQILRSVDIVELQNAWPALKDETKELLSRKYFLQQTDEEIADAFHVKPGSVRMMLTRARREALDLLKGKIED